MPDAPRGRTDPEKGRVRRSEPLTGEPPLRPSAMGTPVASPESRTARVRRFLEAVWHDPAAVLLSFSGPGEDPAPVTRADLDHLAGPEFPTVAWRRGRFTLSYVHLEELPPGFWEFLRRRARETAAPDRLKAALTAWRNRGGIPGEYVYQAHFFHLALDDPDAARRSLQACESRPLTADWLLPAAVAWKTLFREQSRADGLLAKCRPNFDDLDGQFHRALALEACGRREEAGEALRPLCAAPASWITLHNGPAALARALEYGFLKLAEARRDLAALEARPLEAEALIRLAWCQALVLGDEAAAERILGPVLAQVSDWLECQRAAWAWMYLFARPEPIRKLLARALRDVHAVVSLTDIARTWVTLLCDPAGMDQLLHRHRGVLNAGSDYAEVAGVVADVYGPGPRAAAWLEDGERLIDRSYDCERLSEAWLEIFGDKQRAASLAGRGEALHADEMESWDPLKG